MTPDPAPATVANSKSSTFWRDLLVVGLLIVIDMSIHALTGGPDRLIHDPAVYRWWDPNYLPGDWYTGISVASRVYTFYAPIVNAYHWLNLPEEFWRLFLYLTSLGLLYYAIIRIGRVFTRSFLVAPLIVLFHAALVAGSAQPIWLYGPFIQIDGGLAPRSIGVAASFLALFFLTKNRLLLASLVLGLATLVHVSNSLIVFSLFLLAWIINSYFQSRSSSGVSWLERARAVGLAVLVYLVAGGWFALYVARANGGVPADFPTEKFIWTWIDLRAPYMDLPSLPLRSWLRLLFHVAVIGAGWWWLKNRVAERTRPALNLLAIIGLGAFGYFLLFYLFAFLTPWLPGFQFYSLRVVYLAYFVAYLFLSLIVLTLARPYLTKPSATAVGLVLILLAIAVFGSVPGIRSVGGKVERLRVSYYRLLEVSGASVPEKYRSAPPSHATFQYLYRQPEPFLAPPSWENGRYYLPNVASYKSFGFTPSSLAEWYERLNATSRGEIERSYQTQLKNGRFETLNWEWTNQYALLTPEEILSLAERYQFRLFVTYRSVELPFPILAEDDDNRLYQLPVTR